MDSVAQIIKVIGIIIFSLTIGSMFLMAFIAAYGQDQIDEEKKREADNELIRKYNEE